MMTPERLEEIRKRAEAATEGPWTNGRLDDVIDRGCGCCTSGDPRKEDLEFTAHARQDVPELVAEVERLRAAAAKLWDSCHLERGGCETCKRVDPTNCSTNPYRTETP